MTIMGVSGPHSDIWYSRYSRVVNIYNGFPSGAIYIGRAGKRKDGYFGNPFTVGVDGNREEVLKKYRTYIAERLKTDKIFESKVKFLKGKTLVCFCIPKACHGMILAEYADE